MKNVTAAQAIRVFAVLLGLFSLLNCGTSGTSSPKLQTITLTPANPTLAKGENLQLAAMGGYSDGSQQTLSDSVTWQTSASNVASVSEQGQVTGMSEGSAQVSASYQGITGSTTVAIGAPALIGITVSPNPSSVPVGESEQLAAVGNFSDGTVQDLTQSVTWNSSPTGMAAINSTGLVSGLAAGKTTVVAVSGSVQGAAVLSVGSAVLTSITVAPGTASIAQGNTQQFTATGNYSDSSTQDLTSSVTWSSPAPGVATIATSGLATGVSVGTTTINAAVGSGVGSMSGSATLTVQTPTLVSLAVTPSSPSIASGSTAQFAAIGTYNNGTTQDLSSTVTWSSSAPAIAPISSQGLASGAAFGSTTITASAGSITASTSLSVTTGFFLSGTLNTARQFHTATMLNNGTVLIAGGVGASGPLADAELYDPSTGNFTATGSLNNARSQHTATLLRNGTVLIAGGADSNGSLDSAEIYNPATGSFTLVGSLNTARCMHSATMLTNGSVLISGGLDPNNNPLGSAELFNPWNGTFTLTANLNVARNSHTATLLNNGQVLIAGGNPSSAQTAAEIYDPPSATFTSISNLNTGRYNHTATLLNDGTVLLVGGTGANGALAAAEIFNLSTGQFTSTANPTTARFQHTAVLMNNGTVLIAAGFGANGALSSAEIYDPVAASFSLTGNLYNARYGHTATLLNNGQTLVAGGYSGSYLSSAELYQPVSLTPPNLVSISVTPANPTVPLGGAQPMIASGTFGDGSTQQLASATWSSNTPAVSISNDATDPGAAYAAIANGSANVSACTGSICGSTAVTVGQAALVSIAVTPANPTVSEGWSVQFSATGSYTDGSTNGLTSSATWNSSTPGVATISSTGLATGQYIGTSTISATVGPITGNANLTVAQPVVVSLAVNPTTLFMTPGTTLPVQAIATLSNGFTQLLEGPATAWSINGPAIATVSPIGNVTAQQDGVATVVAQNGNFSASATLIVASVTTLNIIPPTVSLAPGETTQFRAIASLADGTTQDVTAAVTWSTLQPNIAATSGGGFVNALQTGSTTVSAQGTGFSGSASVNVSQPMSLSIVPSSVSMVIGSYRQLRAIATMGDGSTQDVSSLATWTSTQPGIVTVSGTGSINGAQVGSTSVSAQYSGQTAWASITVMPLLLTNYFNTANAIASGTDGTLWLTNPGVTAGSPSKGSLCAMIYVFDSNQEMNECCGCSISDSGVRILSLLNDLTANTLTGQLPVAGSIFVIPSDIGSNPTCDPSNLSPTGMLEGWQTNDQVAPGGTYQVTETPYTSSQLTNTNQTALPGLCGFIEQQGSGAGICTCGSGGN